LLKESFYLFLTFSWRAFALALMHVFTVWILSYQTICSTNPSLLPTATCTELLCRLLGLV
jgi:hypothetical protein